MVVAEPLSVLDGPPTPWNAPPELLEQWLSFESPHDAVQLWLLHRERPRADELLMSRGFSPGSIRAWIAGARVHERLFEHAGVEGDAQGVFAELGVDDPLIGPDARVMVHMHPESMEQKRWWALVMARQGPPFTAHEQEVVAASLRLWQASFNRPEEPGMARLIAGADGRLIHADPACRLLLLRHGVSVQRLLDQIREIREQRWLEIQDNERHDIVIEIGDETKWILFHRERAVDLPEAGNWRIEVRPLQKSELPPVGALADERTAKAIAYIHDHYAESPSLADIARFVHVSPFHFHRMFTRQVGISPKHYLQMKQLQVARWRLRSQRTPIGQVAIDAGFASHGHFTSTFRRVVGVSPTTYREHAAK